MNDIFISKGIAADLSETEEIDDLTYNHTSVLLTLSFTVIKTKRKLNLTNELIVHYTGTDCMTWVI